MSRWDGQVVMNKRGTYISVGYSLNDTFCNEIDSPYINSINVSIEYVYEKG